ncbi:MAG: 2-oxoglutarate dehydrogenase E1 component [Desulfobacteraceae bacterium]|nr:2-oxoglutarate dehydrogenase E1 component [Desulfobacteraceae bacterium]
MTYNGPWSAQYIETQYNRWKQDPNSVDPDWQFFFQGFELGRTQKPAASEEVCEPCDEQTVRKQSRVEALVYRYRDIGHLLSCTDPLAACPTDHPLLNPKAFGLDEKDMQRRFYAPGLPEHPGRQMTLDELVDHLRQTYCRSVGVEYMHIQDPEERKWLRQRMESTQNMPALSDEEKIRILRKLSEASGLEQFIHKKYLGQKRFSVEGADVIIPMLDSLLAHAAGEHGCEQIVLGMTHRGRLNVQANILNRPYADVIGEFESHHNPEAEVGAGDVKYHKGFHGQITTSGNRPIDILMADNPSHLESVNPVVEGMARARLDAAGIENTGAVMPLLLHGDAAFSGQGIVAETLNMSQLDGYHTGGTVHIIVNNQIGYTALPDDLRSTRYATDVAKSLMVPIFHIHGENPEAAVHIAKLACDYRMRFGKDVVMDVVCYRRYGHNEGDEPYFTQPLMYERIKNRPTPARVYARQLIEQGVLDENTASDIQEQTTQCIQEAYDAVQKQTDQPAQQTTAEDHPPTREPEKGRQKPRDQQDSGADTAVKPSLLKQLAAKINAAPNDFHLHPKIEKLLKKRLAAVKDGKGIDWANAEALGFATIVNQGISVRLSGQDSQRGTFSQRHSVLFDTATNAEHVPINNAAKDGGKITAINSLLSEAGVLGFEYGYSLVRTNGLTIWEAQFGDFANNAQAVIDLYLASGETKWGRRSGLVLLLPHGYEGQGPDHSSSRVERFLQLAADENFCVCNPTTPAQYYHLLRGQACAGRRKPLIILTPKSLLRHPEAVSSLDDLAKGKFQKVIDDTRAPKNPEQVVLVSGKLFYDLAEARNDREEKNTAIVRVEQLYPFAEKQLASVIKKYKNCRRWLWAQEEPANMGAWNYIRPLLETRFSITPSYIGRKASASTATGYHHVHKQQQQQIIDMVLKKK